MQYNSAIMRSKIIVAVILVISFLIAVSLIYINNVLLPVKLKAKITQELEKNLGKNVQIEKIRYNLFKGLLIQNLVIFDQVKEKQYLSIKEISFNPLIFALLQKKLIIPLLRIDSPQIYLVLRYDNTLNIMDVLKKWQLKEQKAKLSVFVYRIDITNANCQFKDEHISPNYTKQITDLKVGLELKLFSQIKFILQAKILNFSNNPSLLSASGEYNFLHRELNSQIKLTNIIINDYLLYLEKLPVLASDGIINANCEVGLKNKQLAMRGTVFSKDIKLRKSPFALTGDIEIEPEIQYDLAKKELKYKSRLGLSNAVFSGLEYLKDISDIHGNLYLQENKIFSDGLKAQVLDSPLDIKGTVNFSSNQLNWENVSFIYKQIQYNSTGNLIDFQQPKIDFQLATKDLDLKTRFDIQDSVIKIKSCAGKYLNSDFALKGDIDTKNNLLNFKTELSLNLKDIFGLLPANISDNLGKIKLDGNCKVGGNVSGGIKDIKGLNAYLEFSSPGLSIYDLKLDDMHFTLEQKNGLLNINDFTAKLYSGNVNLQFLMHLAPQVPIYESKISFSDIDLAKLKMDTKLKDKDIAGLLNFQLNLDGTAEDLETLQGQGKIFIKDGKLWELNLFKGLGELLFMPVYRKIVFREADISFIVKDKTIKISDSFLGSDGLDLSAEGKIGFDSSLDLLLHTEINETLLTESPDLRKFTSAIVGNLLAIKIGGTWQKPEYKVVLPTKGIINRIKELLLFR